MSKNNKLVVVEVKANDMVWVSEGLSGVFAFFGSQAEGIGFCLDVKWAKDWLREEELADASNEAMRATKMWIAKADKAKADWLIGQGI